MADTAIVESGKQAVQQSTKRVTDYSLGIFGTSDNFIMAMQMAKALADSTIVPAIYQKNPSNCLIAIEMAQRMGASAMMVMQNLYPIQGRPSWSSQFLIARINNSHKFDMELQYEETKDKDGKPFSCTAWTTKDGRRVDGMTVDMQMAKDEGWIAKNGSKWKTMPQLMLRYRAASFFQDLIVQKLQWDFIQKRKQRTMILKKTQVKVCRNRWRKIFQKTQIHRYLKNQMSRIRKQTKMLCHLLCLPDQEIAYG